MIWLAMAVLALITVAPLGVAAWRGYRLRGRKDAAMALHRAQLAEIDRDLADGRIVEDEHAGAKLEVQRRLLADGALPEAESTRSGRGVILVTGLLIPASALALYLSAGHPNFPPPTMSATEQAAKDEAVIGQLRARLSIMDPKAPRTIEGYTILGRAELGRKNFPDAIDAWQHVLAQHFDPEIAAETGEMMTEIAGHPTPEAADLFKRALAAAPADAPWRGMAEKRLAQAGGS